MITRKLNILFLLLLLNPIALNAQTTSAEKFTELKNYFILGLTDKGLELGVELISLKENASVREDALFYLADYFFIDALGNVNKIIIRKDVNIAYTYYLQYLNDYPNSKYSDIVKSRLTTLKSYFQSDIILRNYNNYLMNEIAIVSSRIEFINQLFNFVIPNPYQFFFENDKNYNPNVVISRYFDDIIVNHPEFEIYAYYYKILAELSKLENVNFVKDGLLNFDINKIKLYASIDENNIRGYNIEGYRVKSTVNKMLDTLDIKYPHHPITLNLHLIFAKIFMKKISGKIDAETKKHLEYVVQNELDKNSGRYMLAKEFLLDNKFE